MLTQDLEETQEARRQATEIIPAALDQAVADKAKRRLLHNRNDTDALYALAAWYAIMGEPENARRLSGRLVSLRPDYPGVWWLRARVLRDLGRNQDAIACERIARLYAEDDLSTAVRQIGALPPLG